MHVHHATVFAGQTVKFYRSVTGTYFEACLGPRVLQVMVVVLLTVLLNVVLSVFVLYIVPYQ